MYHLGDPRIHCGSPHDDIELGFCAKATGLGAHVRNIEYLTRLLAEHTARAASENVRLKSLIADQKTILLRSEAGLDQEKITLAETIVYAGTYENGGSDRNDARQDAIKWFATGKGGHRGLKYEYFGTKNYDCWRGQREDHGYGMGPRHGSMCFEIGLKREARERDLSDEEREAAIYYLVNLERIQSTRVKA